MSYYDQVNDFTGEERWFYNSMGILLICTGIILALGLTWFLLMMGAHS